MDEPPSPLAFLQREAVAASEIWAGLQRTVGNAGVAGCVVADASLFGGRGEVAACTLGDQEQQRMVGGKAALCCRFRASGDFEQRIAAR